MTSTISEAQIAAAVRAGCNAADIHLTCSYPNCRCKQTPVIVKAALASRSLESEANIRRATIDAKVAKQYAIRAALTAAAQVGKETPVFECPDCGKDIADTSKPHVGCPSSPAPLGRADDRWVDRALRDCWTNEFHHLIETPFYHETVRALLAAAPLGRADDELSEVNIRTAVTAGNNSYWADAEKQRAAFVEWSSNGQKGDCPQISHGSIVDYITRSICFMLAAAPSPPVQSGEVEGGLVADYNWRGIQLDGARAEIATVTRLYRAINGLDGDDADQRADFFMRANIDGLIPDAAKAQVQLALAQNFEELYHRIATLTQALAEAREVVEPFANVDGYGDSYSDNYNAMVRVGDLRRASAWRERNRKAIT